MCSRAFAPWLVALLGGGCAGGEPMVAERAGFAGEQSSGNILSVPCSSPTLHVLHGPSIGRGAAPARHRESDVELDVQQSAGFALGRSSVVHSAQGDQLLIELKNTEQRWRCGIRSYPSLAYDAAGERIEMPAMDDMGYSVLAATGMRVATREGVRGSCLGPGELGYLKISLSKELAKVTLRLEASSDGMEIAAPPTCVVPESYNYSSGRLTIESHTAGQADPTYKPDSGSGLAIAFPMDAEQLPLAMYSFAANSSDASAPTFVGAISLNAGTSQTLAVLVW